MTIKKIREDQGVHAWFVVARDIVNEVINFLRDVAIYVYASKKIRDSS